MMLKCAVLGEMEFLKYLEAIISANEKVEF